MTFYHPDMGEGESDQVERFHEKCLSGKYKFYYGGQKGQYYFSDKNNNGTIWAHMYLDESAIEDLYAQQFGNVVEKRETFKDSSNISGSFLIRVIHMFQTKVKGSCEESSAEEIKTIVSASEKAYHLIRNIQTDECPQIQELVLALSSSFIFVGSGRFALEDVINAETGESCLTNWCERKLCTNIGSHRDVFFEFALQTDEPQKSHAIMRLANKNFKKSFYHYTAAIARGASFDFTVFGQLTGIPDGDRTIIPYAVW